MSKEILSDSPVINNSDPVKYYLIAGEASGDLHASRLMHQLKEQDPEAQFRFYGGDAMKAEGGVLVRHYRELAYMGFVQVALHAGTILKGLKYCRQDILNFAPDALILIDYPGFNLGIAKWARKQVNDPKSRLKCKICYYISPKIWAWKSYRLKAIRRDIDLMLCILPFEVEWYRKRGFEVNYVGNPTVDELYDLRNAPLKPADDKFILLVPGSRKAEVRDNLHVMLAATQGLGRRVVAGAPGLSSEFYAEVLSGFGQSGKDVQVRFGQTHDLMRHATAAAVTSGTATLEAAYLRCPQVVCYNFKGGKPFYNVMKLALRNIRYVSLVNLLIYGLSQEKGLPDERHAAVCELLGPYLTPDSLREQLLQLLGDTSVRREMLNQYERMAQILGQPGAPVRAAKAITDIL